MDLPALPGIILAIAQHRSLNTVLDAIIEAVARQPDVALARIWLRQADRDCPHCSSAGLASPVDALHLRASRGTPLNSDADWSRTTGSFHRVPLGRSDLKLSHMATTGESVRILSLDQDRHWVRHPEWARAEELAGFAGHPILFRGEILGVLAVFRRKEPGDACWHWLRALADAAAVAIANARAFEQVETLRHELEMERDYLRQEVREEGAFGEILGRSPALNRLVSQVEMVAPTDANVLIQGESGSGKELVARAVHQRSARAHKSMVKVNCGSIPRELFESEFFGHARGSFTGAIRDRIGRFQLADGGTLFLDEVGEIPIELQSKLLRVLQEGEFERVGDEATRRVNVRVIAATNRDLRREVAEGRFRLDLYYRLGVFPMEVPPLRDRLDDIPDLAAHFVRHACTRFHVAEPKLPQRELERARQYSWPGNVRELQNVIERAVILAHGGAMTLELPQPASRPAPASPQTLDVIPEHEWREREKENLLAAMKRANYKISGKDGAAELLGINPATLTSRLKVLGIQSHHLLRPAQSFMPTLPRRKSR
jgi:transcriptional regulator with GAF, ATPase, and Fis domain